MKCPYCGCEDSKVIDSRPTDEGERIRRRRECTKCGKRFTTYEIIETVPLIVVKKDGTRESFDRVKLFNGLLRACEKRPVPVEVVEKAVTDIETQLQNSLEKEITSGKIGELAMENSRTSTKSPMSALRLSTVSSRTSAPLSTKSRSCSTRSKSPKQNKKRSPGHSRRPFLFCFISGCPTER